MTDVVRNAVQQSGTVTPGHAVGWTTDGVVQDAGAFAANALALFINVKDYGATGNGYTDDTAAIQNAMTAGCGAGVYFPAGTYLTSASLLVCSGTTVTFEGGATMRPAPVASFAPYYLNGVLYGYAVFLNVNYAASVITDANITFIGARCAPLASWSGHFLQFHKVQNIKIERPYGTLVGDVTACVGCSDVVIDSGFASSINNCAWDFWGGCTDCIVQNCVSYNSAGSSNGINFNSSFNPVVNDVYTTSNMQALNNSFYNISGTAIVVSPLDAASTLVDFKIIGNYINQGLNAGTPPSTYYNGIVVQRCSQGLIANNTIEKIGSTGTPIFITGDATGIFSNDIIVANNTIANCVVSSPGRLLALYGANNRAFGNKFYGNTAVVGIASNDPSTVFFDNDLTGATYEYSDNDPTTGNPTTPAGRRWYNASSQAWQYAQPLLLPTGVNPYPLTSYEQGTWTPAVKFGGASVGVTYTLQVGSYTRIGRLVFVECYFQLSSKGSSTGNATIAGIPLGTISNGAALAPVFAWSQFVTITAAPIPVISGGTIILNVDQTTGSAQLTDANFNNTTLLQFSGTYMTNG
jgi:hypothetical protein